MSKTLHRGILVLVAILLFALGGGWHFLRRTASTTADSGDKKPAGPQPVIVGGTTVARKNIDVYLDGLGTVQAFYTVNIRCQVDGQITKIAFKEGQDVRRGDLLVQIDSQPLQAQLEQAQAKKKQDEAKKQQDQAHVAQDHAKITQDEAKVKQDQAKEAQDTATLANARVNLKRLKETVAANAATEQSVDDQQTLVITLERGIESDQALIHSDEAAIQADQALVQSDEALVQVDDATILADEAAIRYVQTQLAYTSITSPIDGRIGIRQVDIGNIVHITDATGIVVITQLQPISVIFTLPQQNLVAINDRMAQATLQTIAVDPEGHAELDRGVLELVDNQIDPTTGTIRLKATFPNPKHHLWPGGFVNTRLLLETRKDAVVIPAPAIQQGPEGPFVYFIKPDQTVEARPVKISLIQDGDAVIANGLEAGDSVVLSGQDRLKSGAKVQVRQPKTNGDSGEQNQDRSSKSGRPAESNGTGK